MSKKLETIVTGHKFYNAYLLHGLIATNKMRKLKTILEASIYRNFEKFTSTLIPIIQNNGIEYRL